MAGDRWKRQERAVAAALGTRRIPNSGGSQADVRGQGWSIQVKTRKVLPGWLWSAVEQAARDARAGERPAVVLCEVAQGRRARRLVVLDFEVWQAMLTGENTLMEEGQDA